MVELIFEHRPYGWLTPWLLSSPLYTSISEMSGLRTRWYLRFITSVLFYHLLSHRHGKVIKNFCLGEWYHERNFVVNVFCKNKVQIFSVSVLLKTRPKNILQVGSSGWFQVTETRSGFFKIPGGCFTDTKEGLNDQGLGRLRTRTVMGLSAASNLNDT